MTQLFMNPMFRKFMMNVDLVDPANDQQLLLQTSKLFAQMQNSYQRFIDPLDFIKQIRTYEDTDIDPNIQMDVDEFYNLLFDRFEGQMRSAAEKRAFRSFYGGQLVQQVKSKECPHISERLEPFSAIQCDIKGKKTLEESLQAYVDGEVMEGDNKYKCSTCDKHVDAVKRACLKDIPDNVIFHLKRFDFNLRTMQRSKINDYFQFPHMINMRPYTVEHLMEPEKELPEDVFELVGILVHAGTAESGHYYSFIRERPTENIGSQKWFEFNDVDVTDFDPASIENLAFGGTEYRNLDTGSIPIEKSWNAYMLFYQRSSVVQAQQQVMAAQSLKTPQMPMPSELKNHITEANELILRKYLMNDDNHPEFVLKMMENDHHVDRHLVIQNHHMENLSMTTVMGHLDQVVIRNKDAPQLVEYHAAIKHRVEVCYQCAEAFLEWIARHADSLRSFILRCPDVNVRVDTVELIMVAINTMRHAIPGFILDPTGSELEDDESEEAEGACGNLFERVVQALMQAHSIFHKFPRAWPEFFGLLWKIAHLGTAESVVLIENHFLRKILEILTYDPQLPQNPQLAAMLTAVNKRPATRPVSMEAIIWLCEELLNACDLSAETVHVKTLRYDAGCQSENGRIPLNTVEHSLLMQHWTRGARNILVEKLLIYNQAPRATQEIIAMMLDEMEDDVAGVFNAIRFSLRNATVNNTATCIEAALTFSKYAQSAEKAQQMYHTVAICTQGVNHSQAREHLKFYIRAPVALHENTYLLGNESFHGFMMREIPIWAPSLLTHYDERTRNEAEDYLENTLFIELPVQPADDGQALKMKAHVDSIRALGCSMYSHLNIEYVRPRRQTLRAQMENAMRIIENCRAYYDIDSEDPLDQEFKASSAVVEAGLRRLLIEEQDQELSGTLSPSPSTLSTLSSHSSILRRSHLRSFSGLSDLEVLEPFPHYDYDADANFLADEADEWEGSDEEGFSSEVPELGGVPGALEEIDADGDVDPDGEMEEIPSSQL